MPGDLNLKKSWNPALVKNQKKVWEREQEALKEYQSIKQRSKEIAQEREKEELIRLQYGQDPSALPTKQKLELNKLGWMYEDVGSAKEPEVNESGFREVEEDFLLKKEELDQLIKSSSSLRKRPDSRFDQVTKVGSARHTSSLDDDPLLKIQREQIRKRTNHRERERSLTGHRYEGSSSKSNRKERSPSRKHHREVSSSRSHHRERSPTRSHRRERSPTRSHRRERSPSRSHNKDQSSSQKENRDHLSRSHRDSNSRSGDTTRVHSTHHRESATNRSSHYQSNSASSSFTRENLAPPTPNY